MPGECHVLSLSLSLSLYCHWFSFYVSLTHTHTVLFKKEACLGIYSVVFVTWNLIEHLSKLKRRKDLQEFLTHKNHTEVCKTSQVFNYFYEIN